MAVILTQATLLIRDCLAEFIMSEEQLATFPRVIRAAGDGNITYVVLDAPNDVELFVMQRIISPTEMAYPSLVKLRLREMSQHVSSVALSQDLALIRSIMQKCTLLFVSFRREKRVFPSLPTVAHRGGAYKSAGRRGPTSPGVWRRTTHFCQASFGEGKKCSRASTFYASLHTNPWRSSGQQCE